MKGMGLGKKLGFPTFNLDARPDLSHGVYAAQAMVAAMIAGGRADADTADLVAHPALMHYGPKPTVGRDDVFCEIYFLKFPERLKIEELEVKVLGKIRDVMKFDGLEALVEQMKKDQAHAVEQYFQ